MSIARNKLRPAVRLQIAASQLYTCQRCHYVLGPIFHIDHIVALCNGGPDSLGNLCALCLECHGQKTALDIQKYHDKRAEIRTGKSRFFNPLAVEYLINH